MVWPFNSKRTVLGLDIGFETLKLIQLDVRGKEVFLHGAFNLPLTERIMEKDHFKDKKVMAQMIKESCSKASPNPINARKIVSTLPETFSFSKTIQLEKREDGNYQDILASEAAQYLPLPIEDVYLDYQVLIVHPDEPLVDILFVATPKNLAEEYVEVAKIAGFELEALETKSLAAGRALIPRGSGDGFLIAEMGTEITRISIWDGDKIRLTTTVGIGKNQIAANKDSQAEPGLIPTNDSGDSSSFSVAQPVVQAIIEAIKYHQNRDYEPKPIKKILLCGSGSQFQGIDRYFEVNTQVKTEIAAPGLAGQHRLGSEFVTAYGLALRRGIE